jgi:hypothetical protein
MAFVSFGDGVEAARPAGPASAEAAGGEGQPVAGAVPIDGF